VANGGSSLTGERLVDRFGRQHDYLRISLTDRCNLRCVYCMPAEGMEFLPHQNILRFEEIVEVVEVAASLGVRRLRLTGGEPLVRRDVERLVAMLAAIPGIEDIALTTNGVYLAQKAAALKAAGVTRVNISLDTMRPDRFAMVTRGGSLERVLEGLEASYAAGFSPIKLNVVLMKGVNDDEIDDFLQLSMERPVHVRFIEYMPIGHDDDGWREKYLPLSSVTRRAEALGLSPIKTEKIKGNGPSEDYRLPGAKGSIGLIHPVSEHFCGSCNRLRLTADGHLKPCLYWIDEWSVRPHLGDREALKALFFRALDGKPETHEMAQALEKQAQSHTPTTRRMSQIGG